jgi:hypothetical protein
MIAIARITSIESGVADRGGSRGSSFKPAVPSRLFNCDEAFWVGLDGEGSMAHDEAKRPSEGVLGMD